MSRAELPCLLAVERRRIDGNDPAGSRHASALDRVRPDPADPENHDRVACANLGAIHRGAEAGGDPAAHQRRLVERDVVVDLDDRVLSDDRVGGERAEHAHQTRVLAAHVVAARAVRLQTDLDPSAGLAQVFAADRAPVATPAGGNPAQYDVVAFGHRMHLGPDRLDDAGALVAADRGQFLHR